MNIEEYFKRVWDSTSNFIKVGLSAGSALIGKVSIDQTTPGTTNKVIAGIDQVTGNANEVVVKSITAGSNVVGKVGIDQTTPGTTNKVNATNSTHDNLCANVNIQVGDADSDSSNPVNVDTKSVIDSSLGVNGGSYITGTGATTPTGGYTFFAIQAITDTVISAVTGNIDVSSASISAGIIVYGAWSSITLTSGSVIAYQRVT
jgi:hypothetical protein